MKRLFLVCCLTMLLVSAASAEVQPPPVQPHPEPTPTPDWNALLPAGDPGIAALPTPEAGEQDQLHHATDPLPTSVLQDGPRTITVRVCVDANRSMSCDMGEQIAGVPLFILDETGTVVSDGVSDSLGRMSRTIATPGTLIVNVPYLNVSEQIHHDVVQIRMSYGIVPPKELP